MNIKTTIIIISLWIGIIPIISGCKKLFGPLNNGEKYLVKSYTQPDSYGGSYTTTYTYDNLGRLATLTNNGTYTYTYLASMITVSINGSPYDSLILNSQGLVVNSKTHNEFYIYDSNGYLLRDSNTSRESTYTEDFVTSNGNVVSEVDKYLLLSANQPTQESFIYTYYPDLDPRNFGTAYLGTPSRNLIKTKTSSYPYVCTYTYQFDALGRITQEVHTYSISSSATQNFTYGY